MAPLLSPTATCRGIACGGQPTQLQRIGRAHPASLKHICATRRTLTPGGVFRLSPRGRSLVVNTYPEPETEKERSPLDYPQEWLTPQPSRRPDIFPEFEKLETPMPKPMPGDPEQPEDEEEEDKKKKEEEEENPDEEKPEEAPAEE
mmetsp:Transcript_1302/g.3739  ORF Transcript_1302/g.3739 Transcript_1302/m.3739 type:complete len:146 (-) Transcript_1302:311-748(-)